jgi:small-conductance mechanosensitive channel
MTQDPNIPQDDTGPATGVTKRLSEVDVTNIPQAGRSGWEEVGQDWKEVGEELKQLGVRLSTAIRSGWKSSEQEHQLTGLQAQLRAMADQVEAAVQSVREEAKKPEIKAQTQRTLEAAKEAQATLFDEVRDTLAKGLHALNAQLRELAEKIEASRK